MNVSSKSKPLPINVFFALLPFLVYVITAVLHKLEVISSRNDTILVCNAILFLFAVGAFFITGLPSKAEKDSRLWGLLANLAFPLAAFLMNTSVFGLFIRREALLNDLWNWHLGWIICAALQILFLSGLGSGLLTQTLAVLSWGRGVVSSLGAAVSDALTTMSGASNNAKLTVLAGLVTWAVYTGIQIYSMGLSNVFNTDFIWTSTWLWLAVIGVCILMNNIQQDIKTQNDNIRTYTDLVNRLNSQIANAADDRDTSVLEESLRRYENLILNATQRLPELQDEYSQLYNAQQRLPVYESQLGLNSSTSSTSIRSELMKLQAEFFQQDPDEAIMLNHATEIFKSLRDAASSTSSEPAEDGSTYSELLVQMNRLIQNLRDYSEIKDIEANLDTMISGLRTLEAASGMRTETDPNQPVVLENESAATDGSTPGESEETGGNVSTDGTLPNEDNAVGGGSLDGTAGNEHESASADNDVSGEDAATGGEISGDSALPTGEDNSTGGDSSDGTGNNVDWKSEWGSRLAELKVQISSLPSYSGVQNGTHTVLLESQVEILRKYDRDSSSRELDDVIRRYISVHNAVYQGIIYLQSPYRSLAVFALILALSFDLSGFVFGLVTLSSAPLAAESYEAEPFPETPNPEIPASDGSDLATPPDGEDDTVTWSILPALNPYVVLTGDYEIQDGVYYYKCFRNGQLYRWKVIDSAPYQRGIYTENTESGRVCGKPLAADQALLFSGQPGGPRDGIYRNCQLVYMDGSLLKGGEGEFLASVEEFVPVHIYIPSEGKNRTIPVKMLAVPSGENVDNNSVFVREAVISLTPNGTRVAAIYAIEGNITVRDTALGQKQV